MPTNPFTDVWHFLTATTSDYLHQGNWRYLILALFWALLLSSGTPSTLDITAEHRSRSTLLFRRVETRIQTKPCVRCGRLTIRSLADRERSLYRQYLLAPGYIRRSVLRARLRTTLIMARRILRFTPWS